MESHYALLFTSIYVYNFSKWKTNSDIWNTEFFPDNKKL